MQYLPPLILSALCVFVVNLPSTRSHKGHEGRGVETFKFSLFLLFFVPSWFIFLQRSPLKLGT